MIKVRSEICKNFLNESFFFGLVGTIGFLVDVALLYFLTGFIGLFYGRVVSFLLAVVATWLLNRRWTFKRRKSGLRNHYEFAVYLALMLIGGSLNYGAYVWLIVANQVVQQHPVIGVAVGSLLGMLFNFWSSRLILFRCSDDKN